MTEPKTPPTTPVTTPVIPVASPPPVGAAAGLSTTSPSSNSFPVNTPSLEARVKGMEVALAALSQVVIGGAKKSVADPIKHFFHWLDSNEHKLHEAANTAASNLISPDRAAQEPTAPK